MKLATLKTNTRDGTLIVVNRAMTLAVAVPNIAPTFQSALDNWSECSKQLQEVYDALNQNNNNIPNTFTFLPQKVAAPLPRAYQWADASAYVTHVELVRKARGAEMPENFWTDPLMYQGGSDNFIGPCDDITVADEKFGIDFEAEVAVITNDVPMGVSPEEAEKHIVLFMLVNDVSLRNLVPGELAKSFGFFQSKPATAFSPVAITPDELNDAWREGRVHLPLRSIYNDQTFGEPNAGIDMTFNFPELISHAAKTRHLIAGTIIGSGTVSNKSGNVGSSCIAEKRMLETIKSGKPETEFMSFGDRIKIEMRDANGDCLFGAIEQQVVRYER